jgi:WD40 repeat protein
VFRRSIAAVSLMHRLILAAFGLLMFAAQAAAQAPPVAAAAAADVIAIYRQHVEKRLLRAHFDRAAAKVSLVPFGPPGIENFAVAPNGAFVVYSATRREALGDPVTDLSLLDEAGHALGAPMRSPVGAITRLAVSPKGDRIAVSSDRGWMALLAVEGAGPARRLALRTEFGVAADRQFAFAFRPDGGLVTLVDNWVATYRSNDGAIQRTADLKTVNRDLEPADHDIGLFQLNWSPRDDRFAVSWGSGPMFTTTFDSGGRRLKLVGAENGFDFGASKAEFVDGGNAMILYGMQAPALLHMKSLASTAFGDPGAAVDSFTPLAGGHEIAVLADDQIVLWSLDGKQLTRPVALENYRLGAAAAGAKDEAIVAAERGGWIDLYTKEGKFMHRVQSGARGDRGVVALSTDGATVAAHGSNGTGGIVHLHGQASASSFASEDASLVAIAADGSRIVTEGPNRTLRIWSRDGTEASSIPLKAEGQVPGRLSGVVVSTNGDTIALADEGSAVWLAHPADKSVLRVALAARSVAPLPDGGGFAIGLTDGTVVRLSRDGTVQGLPFKASERGAVDRIVVAPDGQSFIAVEGDQRQARHLAWDGKVLAGPYRADQLEMIAGGFFHEGAPGLILIDLHSKTDEGFAVANLTPPGKPQLTPLDPPR